MKKITFITPADAEFGFGMTGVTQHIASPEHAEDTLLRAMSEPDTALIILDERMMLPIGRETLKKMEERWQGILLVLPSPKKPSAELEDYAIRLIRRAVGYHVRLKL
ncbi:MAG: V-type ATP synthase subunit F [Thermodesulfovibrionales bacterium]